MLLGHPSSSSSSSSSHLVPLRSLPQATKQFLEEINKWTGQYNVSPLSWNVAVKFLMARKFDVLRAIELFHSYRVSQRGQAPPSEGSLLPRITLPLLLLLSPLQVLSSWKILFQPRQVAMEISPIPIPSPPLGGSSWGALLAGACCPQSISLYIEVIDPCVPFPTRCCKATPSVSEACAGAEVPSEGWVPCGAEVGHACAPCHPLPAPQETRLKEGIVKLKPHEEPLRSELLSGKFTILVGGVSPTELSQLGGFIPALLRVGEPDPVSSAERAGPLRSLHRPVHSQAAPPQQERAARGAPGALLPAGPSCGEVSLPLQGYPGSHCGVPAEHVPSQGDHCSPWLEIPWFELQPALLKGMFGRGAKSPKALNQALCSLTLSTPWVQFSKVPDSCRLWLGRRQPHHQPDVT